MALSAEILTPRVTNLLDLGSVLGQETPSSAMGSPVGSVGLTGLVIAPGRPRRAKRKRTQVRG